MTFTSTPMVARPVKTGVANAIQQKNAQSDTWRLAVELQGGEGRRVFLITCSGKNYDIQW